MDYFQNYNITSNFDYGANNIREGFDKIINKKFAAGLSKIIFGIFECIPFIGHALGYAEWQTKNLTFDKRIREREIYVNNQIRTDSSTLQQIFFDTFCSEKEEDNFLVRENLKQVLNNSTPDQQLLNLVQDLNTYVASSKNLKTSDRDCLINCASLLEEAKETALVIGTLISSSSVNEKNQLRTKLSHLLRERVEKLKKNQAMLVPCGYMNGNIYNLAQLGNGDVGGHSILIKIQHVDDKYQLTIYNAGEGLGSHQSDKKRQGRFYPLYFKNIRYKQLCAPKFWDGLTKFAINENPSPSHSCKNVYDFLEKSLGKPRAIIPAQDKSYHQQTINNCTKKCLQVWLHDELRSIDKVYRNFRIFSLQRNLDKAAKINKEIEFSYIYPLAKWGYTENAPLPMQTLQSLRGFFFGSSYQLPLAKEELHHLIKHAREVLQKRFEQESLVTLLSLD